MQNCEDIVLYMPFEGNTFDPCTNISGEVHGAQLVTGYNGVQESAYAFDGIDDYIVVPHSPNFSFESGQDFTICVWIKQANLQNNVVNPDNDIITKWVHPNNSHPTNWTGGYPFSMRILNQNNPDHGAVYFARYDGSSEFGGCDNSSTVITMGDENVQNGVFDDNEWHQYIFRVNNRIMNLFVDGELYAQGADTTVPTGETCSTTNDAPLMIGARSANVNPFAGAIDNLQIWNRALTDEEIGFHYTSTTKAVTTHKIDISPNPSNGIFYLQNESTQKIVGYQVYSLIGELLQEAQLDMYQESALEITLNNRRQELVLMRVQLEDGNWVMRKLIIE